MASASTMPAAVRSPAYAVQVHAEYAKLSEARMGVDRSIDEIPGQIVDAAYKLHTALGPGLLESAYETILAHDLAHRQLRIERQKVVSFDYNGIPIQDGLRVDLLVGNRIVVEIKSAEALAPVYSKQLLTYLRVMNLQVGLLVNFGGATMKEGLRRVVNGYRPPHYGSRLVSVGDQDRSINPRLK
jgi:iron complex transport system substrate-binding protein